MNDADTFYTNTTATATDNAHTYTIPLEIAFNDIRDCRIDNQTTAADILNALLGDGPERPVGRWALLETVYERGVINNTYNSNNNSSSTQFTTTNAIKRPQMVIKELRLLESTQLMCELLKDVCPDLTSALRSTISVINVQMETVVFFNPYFRMLTGLPLSHISMFPEPDCTVGQFNRQVRVKLGLSQDDDRFALFGYYGRHVARLEDKCRVSDLRATWEGESADRRERRIGFFQFQAVPEKADQELLGIDRASWLYVKKESGFWQSNRKLYCVLKGTTLFMYKSDRSSEKMGQIDNVDSCRILNLGNNVMRTRNLFQIIEPVQQQDTHNHPITYTMSSPYKYRVKKWLRVLAKCRRTFESQIPVTFEDPDGEYWWEEGRLSNDCKLPFHQRHYRDRHSVDPNAVPAGQMTMDQRQKFERIDKLHQAAVVAGEQAKDNSDLMADWLEKMRVFAMEATGLSRPGFAEKAVLLVKRLVNKANRQQIDSSKATMDDLSNLYKRYILDLASFPASPNGDQIEFGPQLADLRLLLSDRQYFSHSFDDAILDDSVDVDDKPVVAVVPVNLGGVDSVDGVDAAADGTVDDASTTIGDKHVTDSDVGSRKEDGSILKKMKRLLISSRSSQSNNNNNNNKSQKSNNTQVIIELDPTSPARTDISGCVTDTTATTQQPTTSYERMMMMTTPTVNEPIISDLPPRQFHHKNVSQIDARSTASSGRSSLGQRAKAFWNRVTSPLSAQRDEKLSPTVGGRAFTTTSFGFPLPGPQSAPQMMPVAFVPTPDLMAQFYEFQQFRQFQLMQQQMQHSQSKGAVGESAMPAFVAPMPAPNGPI